VKRDENLESKIDSAITGVCFGIGSMLTPVVVAATTDVAVPLPAVAVMVGAGVVTAFVSNGIYQKLADEKRKKTPES
jgi:hypothetical protein